MNRLKSIYVRLVFFKSNIQYHLRHLLKNYTLKGIRLSINDDKTLSKDLLLSVLQGGYEDKENKVLNEKLESNDIVLELGACIGFNSITAAKINGGKVVSYEANPNSFCHNRAPIHQELLLQTDYGDGSVVWGLLER